MTGRFPLFRRIPCAAGGLRPREEAREQQAEKGRASMLPGFGCFVPSNRMADDLGRRAEMLAAAQANYCVCGHLYVHLLAI